LRPGENTPREEVQRNQRERLFGAMVASVAERGYEATTVADLVELSGVSSRTFYDLFPDKRACFLAATEVMFELAAALATTGANDSGSWEQRARPGFEYFAELIVAQPAAARMLLMEAFAAGPEAVAAIGRAVNVFEQLAIEMLAQSAERATMPRDMISAHVGAMQEIARTRLRHGTEVELPGLMEDLWGVVLSYRPPPDPLGSKGRPPAPRRESLDTRDNADRALVAFIALVAEEGYGNVTVDQIVKRASMSATTFYAHFQGKEDALMAVIDSAGAQMAAAILPAFRRNPDWPRGLRAGLEALFNYLASRPALAKLVLIEVYTAGPEAMECRAKALKPLEALLAKGRERSPETPAIAIEMILGGVLTLAYRQTREKGARTLPRLVPICTYIGLSPFVGAAEAYAVAIDDGRTRRQR
jgi:AcrR family transcriptional regulator